MITKSIPLKEEESFFYLGDIKVKVVNAWQRDTSEYPEENHREDEIIRREYEQKLKRSKATRRLL